MGLTRRECLQMSAGVTLTIAAGKVLSFAQQRKKIPVGVQLYSVREDAAKDLPGVLKAIKEMGYDGVEFAGYYGHDAKTIRQWLDDNGLKCCGSHTGWDTLQPDKLDGTIEFNQTLGNKYLICPWLNPAVFAASKEKTIEFAKRFNELAEQVKEKGMVVGYHAHGGDFKKLNGETAWEVFFSHTVPDVVMQLDLGNCLGGGGDPYQILERFPGRAKTIHLKEHGGPQSAVIAEGEVKWDWVLNFCETKGGTEWYIVEQESYAAPPLETIRKCRENLRKMGV